MSNVIQILNETNEVLWTKDLQDSAEATSLKKNLVGRPVVPIFPAVLKPVRTNSLMNFSKDFFLPTVVNQAIKVEHIVGKIFAIFFALVLDLITFPIRLFTFIPRMITNSQQEEHPLKRYFITHQVPLDLLAAGHARVKVAAMQINQPDKYEIRHVNFIEVPTYHNHEQFTTV